MFINNTSEHMSEKRTNVLSDEQDLLTFTINHHHHGTKKRPTPCSTVDSMPNEFNKENQVQGDYVRTEKKSEILISG